MFTPIKTAIPQPLFDRRAVHIVDLAPTKIAAGSLWPEISGGICSRFESILRKRLTPSAYFEKATDTRYVIVTPEVEDDDGTLLAFRVASELENALNGRCDPRRICIMRASPVSANRVKSVPIRGDNLVALAERCQSDGDAFLRRGGDLSGDLRTRTESGHQRDGLRIRTHFEPIWDARHQAITTYLCAPSQITFEEAGERKEAKPDEPDARERLTMELACLRAGIGALSRCIEAGDRFLLAVQVSFETLCSPIGRIDFAGTCRGLPGVYRQYLNFILSDVPLGVTQSRLAELAMVLRLFGGITATVASGCRSFSAYDGNGFAALALDVARAPADPERVRADIIHVGAAGRTTRRGAMILNAADRRTLEMATAADFQYLHGTAVGAARDAPQRMSHLATTVVLPETADAGSEEWF